ncbi:MAG TPA: PA14 domain-containing protein [Bryobacteraceae bacterium]|nr:PA14 domain-containing protein [Bryobacteraceae bacterium]
MSRAALLLLFIAANALARVTVFPLPPEMRSDHFTVTINGQPAPIAHAASNYYFVSFEIQGAATIAVTASNDDFWSRGVEVQPWRYNIRPIRRGRTIVFRIAGPIKLSITRPGDFSATSEMLFLFANAPEKDPPRDGDPGVRYYGPGLHRENIDAKSGDTIYLAGGAVIFGSINIWGVENVKVLGRGIVVYDGPQNTLSDDGWMHKPNWHAIVMDNARNIEVSGIVCVVRSRTWMIQMQDSHGIHFDNVKEIGGCPGNANQDGLDFIGSGDATVRDCFIRASDDDIALEGNWLGYGEENWTTPGHDAGNITVENCVLSTSISNTVRVNWPRKEFNSGNFIMRDSDVIHMGMGGCTVPFALLEIWADPGGHGNHSRYLFDNVRLEDWYSLLQLRQPNPGIHDIKLRDVWALDGASMVPSVLSGSVDEVTLENVKVGDLPLEVSSGAATPVRTPGDGPQTSFTVTPSVVAPHRKARFAAAPAKHVTYTWLFGDGTSAKGRVAYHAFADAEGTVRDGSGRFRVMLKAASADGRTDWASHGVVVTTSLQPTVDVAGAEPGLHYRYYEGSWSRPPKFEELTTVSSGIAAQPGLAIRLREEDYAMAFEGYIAIPADGGYTFTLLSKDGGRLEIGDVVAATSPEPVAQACSSPGNMMQAERGSIGLKAGLHAIRIAVTATAGPYSFALRWEGPGIALAEVPAGAFFHAAAQPDVSRK